jgi:hypothetical protein
MIRLLRAFAYLRLRLFVNGLRGRRRDALEQVSRISRVLVAAIVVATIVPASAVLAALAFAGARGLALGNPRAAPVLLGIRAVLMVVTLTTVLSPIIRFGGAAASMTRLALLPIPRRALHAVELLTQLADPWILAVLPGLIAIPAGFLAGGDPAAALVAVAAGAAGAALVALLAALGSAASVASALLFRNRRVGEVALIGVVLLLTCASYLPIVLQHASDLGRPSAGGLGIAGALTSRWTAAFPWELYARAVEGVAQPRTGLPWLPVAGLMAGMLVLSGVSRAALGRLLDAPPDMRRKGSPGRSAMPALPLLTPAASAVAWATMRLIQRSVRGRVILFTSPLPSLMMGLLWGRSSASSLLAADGGFLLLGVGSMLTLFSLQTIFANQWAVDRAGLTLAFLSPLSDIDLVVGKAVGISLVGLVPLSLVLAVALALHPSGSPLAWSGELLLIAATFVAMTPLEALLAAIFPASCDSMKLRAGNPHPLATTLAMLATVAAGTACGGAFVLVLGMTQSGGAVLMTGLVALAAAIALAALTLPLVARMVAARRENLAMVAQGR